MAILGKPLRRAIKNVTLGWRYSLYENAPDWMRRRFGTAASWADMLLVDHGIFRLAYLNRHRIDEHAWRSAQPAPHQIAAIGRLGVRTIVNLRGERMCGSYLLERKACQRAGIRMVDFQIRSRAAPSRDEIRRACALFDEIEYPVLLHCKSGADRAGLMSVLYAHLKRGVPMKQALSQLSLRYGHIRQADTGVLDAVFERYLSDTAKQPMPFLEWVDTVYNPEELKATFRADGWANRLVNSVLRRE